MKIEVSFAKSLHENAESYYALAKKYRKKLAGLEKGEKELERKIGKASEEKTPAKKVVVKRERGWFEKFHWFFTSEGFLVISGRDAKGNELVVKKYMEKHDLYFHADIHGAPHTVVKTAGKSPGDASKREAAVFAAIFSRAWASHLPAVDVYSVRPEQVSKRVPTGESIGTGAFMIYGEREWYRKTPLDFSVGLKKEGGSYVVFSGPSSAVSANAVFSLKVVFGQGSKGEVSKKIASRFRAFAGKEAQVSVDDIVSVLPSGGLEVQG